MIALNWECGKAVLLYGAAETEREKGLKGDWKYSKAIDIKKDRKIYVVQGKLIVLRHQE